MRAAVLREFATATAVMMAAAVSDYRPVSTRGAKRSSAAKVPSNLRLEPNPDILKELGDN